MQFILRNEQILNHAIAYLYELEIDAEKPQKIIIKDHKKLRTEQQNHLYWSWLHIISRETGNAGGDLHADFGDLFLPKIERKTRRGVILETKSTTDLSVKRFTEYLHKVEAETNRFFGIMLPHPGEQQWLK